MSSDIGVLSSRNAPAVPIRPRHDGFTEEKRERFLAEVERSGCIRDGCRAAGISTTTVERWRAKDGAFAEALALKLDLAAVSLERLAFDRALNGGEEVTMRDGVVVSIRRKPSDAMLRMLLQGANPGKYGRTAGERQANTAAERRLKDGLRDEVRRELYAEYVASAKERAAETDAAILKNLAAIRERLDRDMLAAGFTPLPDDYPGEGGLRLVAPGWALVREGEKATA